MPDSINEKKIDDLDENIRALLISYFELYVAAKRHKDLYRHDLDYSAVKTIIRFYYDTVKPDYNNLIYNFKNKYIANEILVEKNNSIYERRGVSLVYAYIQAFDNKNDFFDIFMCSVKMHQLLFKPFDDMQEDKSKLLEEIIKLEEEAKEEKNIGKFKKAKELREEYRLTPPKFGGRFRTENVRLAKADYDVPSPKEAISFINSFLNPEKEEEFSNYLNNKDVFEYIDYCVKTVVDLIKYQPFQDGNKRTFRSLLNLMFKKRNLPPVYITPNEREEYKDALLKAIIEEDYSDIIGFYYYKICDSIYELNIKSYIESKEAKYKIK